MTAAGAVPGEISSSRFLSELPREEAREDPTEGLDPLDEWDDAADLEEDEEDVRERFPPDGISIAPSCSLLVVAVSSYDELFCC